MMGGVKGRLLVTKLERGRYMVYCINVSESSSTSLPELSQLSI